MIRKYCKEALSFAAAMMSCALFADAEAAKEARRFATGGEVTSFRYTDSAGVGWTAFVHTFTNTADVATFQNTSGKTLPVRMLAVGGGGAGMDGSKNTPSARRPGGGGGGGGGVTETNAFLLADDIWTIRVGAGGKIPSREQDKARGEAGTSSVSNGFVEVVSVPGGGAGGSKDCRPTVGAAGGGGSGGNDTLAVGAEGNYTNSVGGVLYGPYSGGNGGTSWESSYGGGGGGAGAAGKGETGGEGLTNDITGVSVVYGSGGGGGGHSRVDKGYRRDGGSGGTNAGSGGNCKWDIVDDGATTNVVVTKATAPIANTGAGGAGGVSFGGGANVSDYGTAYTYATAGADGVVIIRYNIPDTPCVGGDVVTVTTNGFRVTYIHTFTNTTGTATFKPSVAFDGTSVRMLVVGGGGAGADAYTGTTYTWNGTGGGGGGGVMETNVSMSADDEWNIIVGAGGAITNHAPDVARGVAGSSSVSNRIGEIVSVLGGGAGGYRTLYATSGAAGGGGAGTSTSAHRKGAEGSYTSSTFISQGVNNPKGGSGVSGGYGGGGGGAGANGNAAVGGVGLASDITGVSVVYGSGGGGGGIFRADQGKAYEGGNGGKNAGNGGTGSFSEIIVDGNTVTNLTVWKATAPVANTGSGGAGGVAYGGSYNDIPDGYNFATPGADGVVIIRYEADLPLPNGLMIIFR